MSVDNGVRNAYKTDFPIKIPMRQYDGNASTYKMTQQSNPIRTERRTYPVQIKQQQQQQYLSPWQQQQRQTVPVGRAREATPAMAKALGADDLDWPRLLFAETMATLFFFFPLYVVTAVGASPLAISLTHGFVLFVVLSVFWSERAGYVNPTVVLLLWIFDELPKPWWSLLIYLLGETVGALIAVGFTAALVPASTGFGAPGLAPGVTNAVGFLFEFFGSIVLHSVIVLLVVLKKRYDEMREKGSEGNVPKTSPNPALVVGLTLAVLNIPGVFITGGAFNWFRHFWPALISGTISGTTWWIYLVGPLVGAIVAWLVVKVYVWWISRRPIPTSRM